METIDEIQETNIEALSSKYSAVLNGYYDDDFISYFCKKKINKEIVLN